MATDKKEQKELWVGFAHDAISRYVIPDDIGDSDELVDDMAEVATKYADEMLDQLDERFGGASGSRGSGRRRGKPEEETD